METVLALLRFFFATVGWDVRREGLDIVVTDLHGIAWRIKVTHAN